jgi:hypothetical protein
MKREYQTRIFFHDEVPRLGAGLRTVTVRVGRKWVYLTDVMGRRARIYPWMLEQLTKPSRHVTSATRPRASS